MFLSTTKILIVDDFLSIRQLLTKFLTELGFTNLTEAEDAKQAWELIEMANPPFELILSDWNMPEITGFALLKRIRANPKHKTIPFIMVTTENETSKIVDAVVFGANNYIMKPFTAEEIRQKLEAVYTAILAKSSVK